jgi:hypothetical protein
MTPEELDEIDQLDSTFGFDRLSGAPRLGWLLNTVQTIVYLEDNIEHAAMDLYFLQQNGETFKGTMVYQPYFYVKCKEGAIKEILMVRRLHHYFACTLPISTHEIITQKWTLTRYLMFMIVTTAFSFYF